MPKKDEGHEETEAVLREIEKRISEEYKQAADEVHEKLLDYLRRFEIKDEIKRKAWKNGLISEQEYKQWRVGQIAIGQRWAEMEATLAQDYTNANIMAKSIAYGYMPDVYAINHNYGTYQVEKAAMVDTSYTLYDRDAVRRLFDDNNTFYPAPGRRISARINEGKDLAWNKRQIQSVMMQGILQGESIPKMATRLAKTVGETNRKAAIRNVRTMTTAVQNAGRVDSYKRAEAMGIDMEQEWLATLDGRTRHEHRLLDGQRVPVGEPFEVEGEEIMFPGDPAAPAHLIYNCRCTLIAALKGFSHDARDLSLRRTDKMGDMSYEEWKAGHGTSQDILTQEKVGEAMRWSYNNEYRRLNSLNQMLGSGNVVSGAISGALNPNSKEATEHAERYYGLVRSMTTDVAKIAENTDFSEEDVKKIKDYVFIDEHDLDYGKDRFFPDYDMAESWQRLIEGKAEPHDITLLNHELMELGLVEKGYSISDAHKITEEVYNYGQEVKDYHAKAREDHKE